MKISPFVMGGLISLILILSFTLHVMHTNVQRLASVAEKATQQADQAVVLVDRYETMTKKVVKNWQITLVKLDSCKRGL